MALKDLTGTAIVDDPWHPSPMPRFEVEPITLRGMRFELLGCEWDWFGVTVRVSVPDRDTDTPIEVMFRSAWPEPPRSHEHMATMLEAGIAWMVAHEMAERMLVYGKRRDPHARDQGPPPRSLRFPLRLDPAFGMQPLGSFEPLDAVAVLTRSEVIRTIEEHMATALELNKWLAPNWRDRSDEVLRAMLRGLRAKAASTQP